MTEKKYMIIPSAMKKLLRIYGRVPLNDDEIVEIWESDKYEGELYIDYVNFARAIEKAHGIGEKE